MGSVTQRKPTGMSFQTWVEQQIAGGMERGDFAALPGAGRPLPRKALSQDAYDWALDKARREGVETAEMLPPGLRLRRERDQLPARAARLTSEAQVRALAEDYNTRVQAFWRRPQESRWAPLPGLADVEALVAGWRHDRPPPPPAPAPPPAVRRWWRRRWS